LPERWANVVENNGDYIADWCLYIFVEK
jgi:hypothetical protein